MSSLNIPCILLLLEITALGAPSANRTWFVSATGNDQNPGTKSRPFASLAAALQMSRQEPKAGARLILMNSGRYFGVAVRLGPQDSGLTISGFRGAKPALLGGQSLTGFQPDGPRFWAAALPAGVSTDFRLLLVNGRLAERARYPEKGRLTHLSDFKVPWMGTFGGGWKRKPTHEELTTMIVRPDDLGQFFEPTNVELTVYHEWDESTLGVRSYDPSTGRITFSTESGHPPGAFGNHDYVIWNTRNGLIHAGQWYLDRAQRRVVYWPLPGEDPSRLQVLFPTTETIIAIAGSADNPVHDLTVTGLTLALANTPLKAGGFGAQAFDGAITADHIADCHFSRLTIQNIAGQGIKVSEADRCSITQCTLSQTGAGGILARGSNLLIRRNQIDHAGRMYPSAIAVACYGNDNRLLGNYISSAPYVGLTCDGFRADIEANRIEEVMQELHDGAGIYLGGTNHLIRSNFCFHIGQTAAERRHAYYLDEHVRDSILEENLALECSSPLHNHMATNNLVVNNVFVNHGDLRLSFYRCAGQRLERNLLWASGKIEVFGPEAVEVWTNNIFYSQANQVTAIPLHDYAPTAPAPLRQPGVLIGRDPKVQVRRDGAILWPKHSGTTRIKPFDVRHSGRTAGAND